MRLFDITIIAERLGIKANEFDRLLKRAKEDNVKRILAVWNRGLGDIPLGLCALVDRVKTFLPEGEITFLTRLDLLEAFSLLEGIRVIGVPWWERGVPIDLKRTLKKLDIAEDAFDMILEKINPTKWLQWQIGHFIPRLVWKSEYDDLCKRFDIDDSISYVGVHLSTETQQFYGYRKDWPLKKWNELFDSVCRKDVRVLLFGMKRDSFESDNPYVTDLRGETSLLEMLSIIKNRCNVLIAPDGGVLSVVYYLNVNFPITVISLWSDPNQGVLKQSVPSPNPGLLHIPLIGRDGDVTKISVEEVLRHLKF